MRLIALLMALLFGSAAYADTLTMPYTFVPSTPILSAQVNGNFAAVTSWSTRITNSNIKANAGILPNKLDLTQSFPVLRAAGFTCFSAGNTGDSNPRWLVTADGFMQMGPGGATAADVTLKRKAASTFSVRNAADTAYGTLSAGTVNTFIGASDANPGTALTSASFGGAIQFGAGGASALDIMIRRDSGDTLVVTNAADTLFKNLTVQDLTAFGAAAVGDDLVLQSDLRLTGVGGVGGVIEWADAATDHVVTITPVDFASHFAMSLPDIGVAAGTWMLEPSTVTPGNGKLFYSDGTRGKMLETGVGTTTQLLHGATGAPTWGPLVNADITNAVITPSKLNIFTSADQTITAAGSLTIAHGLGRIPTFLQAYLVNVTNANNYVTGEIVAVQLGSESTSATDSRGVSVVPDATNLNIRFGSSANTFNVLDKTTGATAGITNANWTIRFIAF
jgi:hypothetical protein